MSLVVALFYQLFFVSGKQVQMLPPFPCQFLGNNKPVYNITATSLIAGGKTSSLLKGDSPVGSVPLFGIYYLGENDKMRFGGITWQQKNYLFRFCYTNVGGDTRVLPKWVQVLKTPRWPKIFSRNTLSTISKNPYLISFQGLHSTILVQKIIYIYILQKICSECCIANSAVLTEN